MKALRAGKTEKLFVVSSYLTANNTHLHICSDNNGTLYLILREIVVALGYSYRLNFTDDTLMAAALKTQNIPVLIKSIANIRKKRISCILLQHVVELLTRFIKLTLVSKPRRSEQSLIHDNARMEAERLVEFFNTEYFKKPSTVKEISSEEELKDVSATENKEETKMETLAFVKPANKTDDGQKNAVHVLTVEDIEDIGNRASSLAKVYGCSCKQSLIAATKLKSEEINRDLSVILQTLNEG